MEPLVHFPWAQAQSQLRARFKFWEVEIVFRSWNRQGTGSLGLETR